MTIALSGYQIGQPIYTGVRTRVYQGQRISDNQNVILKFLRNPYPTFRELLQFRNQYTITKNLKIPGIIRPNSLEPYGNSYALVMEDFGEISLQEYSKTHSLELIDVLSVAIQLAQILHDLHQNRVIHKDIKPDNILIHPDTKQVKLIDFSIASLLPKETQEIKNPNGLEGTLAYLSPEQTGRMNRGIDYRSDFYCLGVTLFELLVGELPFQSDDPMELVHSHIAKQPPSLTQFNVPEAIAAIVMKLMAKNAEDRYQSALGLKYDLGICRHQLKETDKIDPFEIGTKDIGDRFLIPEKLYGREAEVQILLDAFDRVASPQENRVAKGSSEMLLVTGFSGIGKTAVVNEVHKPIVAKRGYFIKGKYDQFNRNVPFNAFVQAFRDLMRQLLSESDAELTGWRFRILEAVGDSGQVLIDVIPELERVIGKQPAAPELSGAAEKNRFNLLLQKFMAVFCTAAHPLVMFLDDLQWADAASLNLLQVLMGDRDTKHLLLLGAYRDNEVSPTHPLMLALAALDKQKSAISTIALTPLSKAHVNQLVAETLKSSLVTAQPLTELVYRKTRGNSFFTIEFLKGLYHDGLIAFDATLGVWECDLTQVQDAALTDDVVDFMTGRLQKFPIVVRECLQTAACIGNQFDLETLAVVSDIAEETIATDLWPALQAGLLLPVNDNYKFFQGDRFDCPSSNTLAVSYRFLHDRVQQAAYSLIRDDRKQATHYRIGRRWLQGSSSEEVQEQLFDIVNQLNMGQTLLSTPAEREQLLALNRQAGQKAKSTTAYDAAKMYFQAGMGLLATDAWQTAYHQTFELHYLLAEAQLMSVEFAALELTLTALLQNAQSDLDRAKASRLQVAQFSLQGQYQAAIEAGLRGLAGIGVEVDLAIVGETVEATFESIFQQLQQRSIASLETLPMATNPHAIAAIELLLSIMSAAYISGNWELYSFMVVWSLKLVLEQGNTPKSSMVYSTYGEWIGLVKQDYQQGLEFGNLALHLSEQRNDLAQQASTGFLLGGCIYAKAKHVRGAAAINTQGFQAGMESGELQYAGYNLFANIYNRIFQGESLDTVGEDLTQYLEIARKIHNDLAISVLTASRFWLQTLASGAKRAKNDASLEPVWLEQHQAAGSFLPLGIYYILQMQGAVVQQDFDRGIAASTQAKKYLIACKACTIASWYFYYNSLALLGQFPQLAPAEQTSAWEQVTANQAQLQILVQSCPENFHHQYLLVEAERSRLTGDRLPAMDLYDAAISGAKTQGFLHDEALANECAAKFYLDWHKEHFAALYIQAAYYGYARWGATAKIADLENRYPKLLQPILQASATSRAIFSTLRTIAPPTISVHSSSRHSSSSSSLTSLYQAFDFASVLKASQALSRTIQLDELLRKLTQVILQNSGGDRCALILPSDTDEWQVRAIATPDETQLCAEPLTDNPHVPVKLIQYVKNIQEVVVIDDLETDLPVMGDYLQQHQPKSVLCLPILNQGHLIGLLYLKNGFTRRVFTDERILILNFLCTQAAISLENARLYRQEQRKTQEIAQKETEYRSIFESVNDGLSIADLTTGQTVAVNPTLCRMHGYSCEEMPVLQPRTLIHPSCFHKFGRFMEKLNQGEEFYTQGVHVRKDGSSFDVEVKSVPFIYQGKPHGLSIIRDISDRKRAEVNSRLLASVVESSDDAIITKNLDGIITSWNRAAVDLFGYTEAEAIGQPILMLFPPDRLQEEEQIITRLKNKERIEHFESVRLHKDGSPIDVSLTISPLLNRRGEAIGASKIVRDIRDRKAAEAQLYTKNQELEIALTQLKHSQLQLVQSEKMSALGSLVAGVAHEINNPVGCILGNVGATQGYINDLLGLLELYAQKFPDPGSDIEEELEAVDLDYVREDLPKLIRAMKDSGDRIKSISKSLRTFSRADTDSKQVFDLREGIDSTVLILRHRLKANERRPAIEVMTDYGDLPAIPGFPGQLNQVFMNILANAIDALDEASQHRSFADLEANPQRITIRAGVENQQVKIVISDNGLGIPDAVKAKIFDPLFTTKGVGKGTGLGLAIVRQIVEEKHGGKIEVFSPAGQGTQFKISLNC